MISLGIYSYFYFYLYCYSASCFSGIRILNPKSVMHSTFTVEIEDDGTLILLVVSFIIGVNDLL